MTFLIFVQIILQTSLLKINTNVDVSVTPNPASNILFVTGLNEIAKISIFDLNGNLLYGKESDNYQIDISNYQVGIYIVKIETANWIVTKKFIKQ